jgi:hypothetical protein
MGNARFAPRNIALALAASVIALAAVEGALRLFTGASFGQQDFPKIQWLVKDPSLGWENRRDFENFNFSINSSGYRGLELPKRKPDGSLRVVALGDSSTFGLRVADDADLASREALRFDNYPEELARLFEVRHETRIEVINAGVVGYTSAHGLRQLVMRIAGLSRTS